MGAESLPISHDAIRLFDYVAFKRGVDAQGLSRIVTKVVNRRWPHWKAVPSKMGQRVLRQCIQRGIVRELSIDNESLFECDPLMMKPVIEQKDYLKRLADQYQFDFYRCNLDI